MTANSAKHKCQRCYTNKIANLIWTERKKKNLKRFVGLQVAIALLISHSLFPCSLSSFKMWMFLGNMLRLRLANDTSNRRLQLLKKKQSCNTFSQGKVHLYALLRHGRKYLCKEKHFFLTQGKGVEVLFNFWTDQFFFNIRGL